MTRPTAILGQLGPRWKSKRMVRARVAEMSAEQWLQQVRLSTASIRDIREGSEMLAKIQRAMAHDADDEAFNMWRRRFNLWASLAVFGSAAFVFVILWWASLTPDP